MVTWKAKVQGKALAELWEKGLADPKLSKASDIDRYWKLDKAFEEITMDRFRDNYRKCASNYMGGKAIQGVRKRDLKFNKNETAPLEESTEEPEPTEEFIEEEVVEEIIEENKNKETMKQVSPTRPTMNSVGYKYKDDEKKWEPFYQSYKFDAGGYHCIELVIEPPASFDGSDDKYQISLTDESKVLVVKFAPNQVLSDPFYLNGFKKNVHGFETVTESSRNNAAEAKRDEYSGKWYTFRYRLDWPAKPSMNMMGTMPWFAFTRIRVYDQRFPVVVINLCSIDEPIKIRKPQVNTKLSKVGLDYDGTPQKAMGVNLDSPNAQMASMLEGMFRKGFSLEDIARQLNIENPPKPHKSGSGMDIDGVDTEIEDPESKKRKDRPAGGDETVFLGGNGSISGNQTVA